MAFDIGFIIGADDSEFRTKLASVEGSVGRTMGRVGQIVEARTTGVRKLVGAFSSVSGVVTASLGVVGALGVGIGLVVSAWRAFNGEQEVGSQLARDLNERYSRTFEFVDQITEKHDQWDQKVLSIHREYDDLVKTIEGLDKAAKGNERAQSEIRRQYYEQRSILEQLLRDEIARSKEARATAALNDIRKRSLEAEVASLTARGNVYAAQFRTEQYQHEERISAIDELRTKNADLAEAQLEIEIKRHNAAMDLIFQRRDAERDAKAEAIKAEEERARREAELSAERERREQERAAMDRLRNDQRTEDLEVRRLELLGRDREANELRIQLQLERQIADIRENSGATEAEKRETIAAAREVASLEIQALDKAKEERLRSRGLQAGLNLSTLLRVQAIGSGSNIEGSGSQSNREVANLIPSVDQLRRATEELTRAFNNNALAAVFGA